MRITKIESRYKVKEVDYFGNKLYVPIIANFLATDMEGEIRWFSVKPFSFSGCWTFVGDGKSGKVGDASFDSGEDWTDTLIII